MISVHPTRGQVNQKKKTENLTKNQNPKEKKNLFRNENWENGKRSNKTRKARKRKKKEKKKQKHKNIKAQNLRRVKFHKHQNGMLFFRNCPLWELLNLKINIEDLRSRKIQTNKEKKIKTNK
jgi:hypothetical protein